MSEPVRIVTPRLQAAIERAVELLDKMTTTDPVALMFDSIPAEELRAELLEAFDEAISGRDEPAEDPKEIEE